MGYLELWRRGRDSNPRYAINVYTLSRRATSTTHPPLRKKAHYTDNLDLCKIPIRSVNRSALFKVGRNFLTMTESYRGIEQIV